MKLLRKTLSIVVTLCLLLSIVTLNAEPAYAAGAARLVSGGSSITFDTLIDALDAASSGDTVQLLQDVDDPENYIVYTADQDMDLTLDLNGHSLRFGMIEIYGDLVINGSGGTLECAIRGGNEDSYLTLNDVTYYTKEFLYSDYYCTFDWTSCCWELTASKMYLTGDIYIGGEYGVDFVLDDESEIHLEDLDLSGANTEFLIENMEPFLPEGVSAEEFDGYISFVDATGMDLSEVILMTEDARRGSSDVPVEPQPAEVPSAPIRGDLDEAPIDEYKMTGKGAAPEPKQQDYSWYNFNDLDPYAQGLYSILQRDTAYGTYISAHPEDEEDLTNPANFKLPEEDEVYYTDYEIEDETVQEAEYEAWVWLAGESKYRLAEQSFRGGDFYTVDASKADKSINYGALEPGAVVKNTAFNGIYVTSLKKSGNPNYDAESKTIKENIFASFEAFDLDHPEIFWLTGSTKVRVTTVTKGGQSTSFYFLVLADDKGFSMLQDGYATPGKIDNAVATRDSAVKKILDTIPSSGNYTQKIKALNKWLTENNEYNRTKDLTTIGFVPHRSISALTGKTGTNGPVCDGYSRAFKLLCDRLGIPCMLVAGNAYVKAGAAPEYHMWNQVKLENGIWYGADITWDDPLVADKNGARSGYENEWFLLVSKDTVINGLSFGVSHQPLGSMSVNINPFADVFLDDYYGTSVEWAFNHIPQITDGVSKTKFAPERTVNRGQAVTFLWRAMGCPKPKSYVNPFEDVKSTDFFYEPVLWAFYNDTQVTDGKSKTRFAPYDNVTRGQMVTYLWRTMGKPGETGQGQYYEDPERWANSKNMLSGTLKKYNTFEDCPRGDVVFYLWEVLK